MDFRRSVSLLAACCCTYLQAQQINLSLHATAVPDSFEVRATSTGVTYDQIISAVFTVRWEAAAGGVMSFADMRMACNAYLPAPTGGVQQVGDFNYFCFALLSDRNLSAAGCQITTAGMPLLGFRIRQLAGCRNVQLIQNLYTAQNNRNYFISMGGSDVTGQMNTSPIQGGTCGPCVPPVILDVSTTGFLPCVDPMPAYVEVVAEGFGLEYKWFAPGATQPFQYLPAFMIPNPVIGSYQVVVSNACGADAAWLGMVHDLSGLDSCEAPVILGVTTNAPICEGETLHLVAEVEENGPCTHYSWSGQNVVAADSTVTTAPNSGGSYVLTVENACGNVSMTVVPDPGSTCTGPPVIHGITTSGGGCSTDTTFFLADVEVQGNCISYHWIGDHIIEDGYPSMQVTQGNGVYWLVVTNECGSTMEDVVIVADFPEAQSNYVICTPEGPLDLFPAIEFYAEVGGGYWTHDGVAYGSTYLYDPAVDTTGHYIYHYPNGCAWVDLNLSEYTPRYAGVDASLSICSNAPPVDLSPLLGADSYPGGNWYYDAFGTMNGIYDPAYFTGSVIVFRYMVGPYPCRDTAYVTVTEVPATAWYTDVDGDGLGDPADSVLSCDPVEGRVSVGGDACPQIFGTVGDTCDDGDPGTSGEVINAECVCAGGVGVEALNATGGWRLWPNPAHDQLFLQGRADQGPVVLTVLDASGRTVQQRRVVAGSAPITVETGSLAPGAYGLHLRAQGSVQVLRFVVQ